MLTKPLSSIFIPKMSLSVSHDAFTSHRTCLRLLVVSNAPRIQTEHLVVTSSLNPPDQAGFKDSFRFSNKRKPRLIRHLGHSPQNRYPPEVEALQTELAKTPNCSAYLHLPNCRSHRGRAAARVRQIDRHLLDFACEGERRLICAGHRRTRVTPNIRFPVVALEPAKLL